jgi:hypothetical protein
VRHAEAEICDLLTAMNTGHEGGCGTVHANSTADIPARLEALASLGRLPRPAFQAQLAAALDAVIHVARDDSACVGYRDFDLRTRHGAGASAASVPFQFRADGDPVLGPGSRAAGTDPRTLIMIMTSLCCASCVLPGTPSSGAKSSQPTRSASVGVS